MYDYINKHMKGKKVIVIVTKMESYKDTPSSRTTLRSVISGVLNPDIREKATFHLTSGHELFVMQKLEAFVESNPDLDGKDLRLAITELSMSLGDNHLSVKTMQNRQLVLEHVNNRLAANDSNNVMKSIADLFINSDMYSYRGHFAALKSIHDSWLVKLNEINTLGSLASSPG